MSKLFSKNQPRFTILKTLMIFLTFTYRGYPRQSSNLLVNGNFTMDNLNGNGYYEFPLNITGWNCTRKCQVDDCAKMNQLYISWGSYNANCTGNVVDLISDDVENLTQNVVLDNDYYNLSLKYYYPRENADTKTFQIYFNQVRILSHTPNVKTLYIEQYFEKQIKGIAGLNTLRFTTVRNSGWDTFGFFVGDITLIKPAITLNSSANTSILNEFTLIIARIPGSRIIFMDFMTFFINFDRLQLYYYHNRNYSQYSNVLLSDINILNDLKGMLFLNILQKLSHEIVNKIDSFFSSIDYKYAYTPSIILQRNQSGGGFVSNCYPFLVYNIPGAIIIYLLLLWLFEMVKKRPASRLVRKFSFFGILLPMIFEGNIESLTYYSIGEMKLFFSANFHHRFINTFIVFFQFTVTIVAVGSVLYFKYHYRKLIFYFIQGKRNNHLGILCQIIDNGVICMIFGIVHQILFARSQLQLFILLTLQCVWMTFKLHLLSRKAYQKSLSQSIMFSTGLVRICFIITFYFYERAGEMQSLINDAYHKGLVIIMIFLWLQELSISVLQIALSIPNFLVKLGLIQRKTKQFKSKKAGLARKYPFNIIQPKTNQSSIIAIDRNPHKSLYRVHSKQSANAPDRRGRVFEHQKVLIAQLRTKGMFSQNHRGPE